MGSAYTPGLKVTDSSVIKKDRILPLKGKVLVKKGDKVKSNDVVAETHLPGNVYPLNVANLLGVSPQEISEKMLKKVDDKVEKGEAIALSKSFFGLFKNRAFAPVSGTIESISPVTGQVLFREPPIKIQVKAYIDGEVVEVFEDEGCVIETNGAFIQGIFGIGEERNGILEVVVNNNETVLEESMVKEAHKGKIIVGGSMVTLAAIKKAIEFGVTGIVVGGIDDKDIKDLIGYDIGVAITGNEGVGITIVVTEGFGNIKMAGKTFNLLKEMSGKLISINGATQIRAGVMRPEVIIPLDITVKEEIFDEEGGNLNVGTPIRVIRAPYFGRIGKVTALPHELHVVESETKVRVLELQFDDDNTKAMVPRANVEVIEE